MIDYIFNNVHWLFDGIGIAIIVLLWGALKFLFIRRNDIKEYAILYAKKLFTNYVAMASLLASLVISAIIGYNLFSYKTVSVIDGDLTPDEIQRIDDYVENVNVDDGVGQLFMVGVPADFNNYKDIRLIDEIFARQGIGNVIVNGYNYYNQNNKYDDSTYLDSLIIFNNALQEKARRSKLSLPLLLATDFESSSFTSIRSGLIAPPSALAIGASRSKELTYLNGQLVGKQLSSVGIHLLLGPVLDSYNVSQSNRSTLQDRCFAGSPSGVVSISSHFIKGVRESGLHVIAKHFPSYGTIEDNPHDLIIPTYEGSPEQLQCEIKPFLYIKELVDGLMTSHVTMQRLDNNVATFSPAFIQKTLDHLGFHEQIIMTDDLSSMGAIKKYISYSGDSFNEIAIKSFAAGHDVLLFSHFSEIDKRSQFSVSDLISARYSLSAFIKSSKDMEARFRKSLRKVITLKARIAKAKDVSIEGMLVNNSYTPVFHTAHNGSVVQAKIKEPLSYGDLSLKSAEDLVRETIKRGCTLINKNANYDLRTYKSDIKLRVYTYKQGLDIFGNNIKPIIKNTVLTEIPGIKGSDDFASVRNELISTSYKYDMIIYTVYDRSDADLIENLLNRYPGLASRLILFCHNSPMLFSNSILNNVTIVSTFTNHPLSYDVDIDVLLHDFTPASMANLPISIGGNGKIYNAGNSSFIEPVNSLEYEKIIPKYLMDERTVKSITTSNYLMPKRIIDNVLPKIVFVIIDALLIFLCIKAIIMKAISIRNEIKEGDLFNKPLIVIYNGIINSYVMIGGVLATIALNVIYFSLI